MNGFGCTNSSQIAVALVGENEFFGKQPFYSSCNCRSTAVRCLLDVNIHKLIGKYRAAYRSNSNSFGLDSHFFDNFHNYTMGGTVTTSWTIAKIFRRKQFSTFVNNVFRLQYFRVCFKFCHIPILR